MKLDPMQIFFFIIRAIIIIGAIVLIVYALSDLRLELKVQDMERLNTDLAENILASSLTAEKSIFNPANIKCSDGITVNGCWGSESRYLSPDINVPYVCGYNYYVKIDGLEQKPCDSDDDCRYFCMNMCSLGENTITGNNYNCKPGLLFGILSSRKCECRCDLTKDDWYDTYEFSFGSQPSRTSYNYGNKEFEKVSRDYPVGIYEESSAGHHLSSVSPARMTLTLYDTRLTRMECLAQKSNTNKKIERYTFSDLMLAGYRVLSGPYASIGLRKFDNQICIFWIESSQYKTDAGGCIKSDMPLATFFDSYKYDGFKNVSIVSYPIKTEYVGFFVMDSSPDYTTLMINTRNNCNKIYNNREYIAKDNDNVGTVVFCMETERNGAYPLT